MRFCCCSSAILGGRRHPKHCAVKTSLTRSALDFLYHTSAYRLIEPWSQGVGVIFTLHHVRKRVTENAFSPNRILEVSTNFLDAAIAQARENGCDIVSLDEACRRLADADFDRRFVCFTLDDGYADNYVNALPVFQRHNAPFTVYVTTGLPDGDAVLWWRHLEDLVRDNDEIAVRVGADCMRFRTRTIPAKWDAYRKIYWAIRALPLDEQRRAIGDLLADHDIDAGAMCRQHAMDWETIGKLAQCDLATIGAHTIHHWPLRKLPADDMRAEADESRRQLADRLGRAPRHFAYPYGDAGSAGPREFAAMDELGFATATTTRKGVLFPEHAGHLHALPRISLNGDYQSAHYVRLFLSGAPFALARRFRRLDVH